MSRWIATIATLVAMIAGAALAPAAQAETFGIHDFDVRFTNPAGEAETQAGAHPFAMTTTFKTNLDESGEYPVEQLKDVEIAQIPGFVGDQTAVPTCQTLDFLANIPGASLNNATMCPNSTVVGRVRVAAGEGGGVAEYVAPLYNLEPAPGYAARLGFQVAGIRVPIDVGLSESPPYELVAHTRAITQVLEFLSAEVTLWGVPADPRHDFERGNCMQLAKSCGAGVLPHPFLTMPRSCAGPLATGYATDGWLNPGSRLPGGEPDLLDPRWATGQVLTHDGSEPPNPQGMFGCGSLNFAPGTDAQPTSKAATSPSGLDFSLNVNDEGLKNPKDGATAAADVKKLEVTLPEGFTTNPSLAEGLAVCSEAQLAEETAFSGEEGGCPEAAKVGTVEIESPLTEELIHGALYIAKPYENPFGTLLAMYIVAKSPTLGVKIVQAARIDTDPATGRITTTTEDMPELPLSHVRIHFREGTRSPLATPPGCGSYDVSSTLYPSSGGAPVTSTSTFQIITGPEAGLCPTGGTPPFHPGLIAGSINNAAGAYSPFDVRLSRTDSEQEITHFSIKLPPGITGKLAGIPFCSDLQIAAAKAREGRPHGGQEELDSPSCPAASQVGSTLVGSGVGPSLAYAPGKVYLAGPYHGSQLSVVAITAAEVGPFDLGTVVVREALRINPETAEVFVDATGSDPIPHIIDGIPVHLRDIRVYVDRPQFALNPTSCEPTSTASTLLGSGTDFASEADDQPVTVTTRYQAADCANLGFKPRLQLKLKGKTKRSGTPALTATLRPRVGDANAKSVSVALPHSEFLDNAHIGTLCTRVQFAAGAGNGAECPQRSIYGKAKVWTPLFDQPLEGPIFLRSNGGERELPDLVLALHGLVDFDAVGYIDSVKGGIRNTFAFVPDAPITKVEVSLFGGKKGLLENHVNICERKHFAMVKMEGHNGRLHNFRAPLEPQCKKKGKKHARRR